MDFNALFKSLLELAMKDTSSATSLNFNVSGDVIKQNFCKIKFFMRIFYVL